MMSKKSFIEKFENALKEADKQYLIPMKNYVKAFQRYQMEDVEIKDLILFVLKNYNDKCDGCHFKQHWRDNDL